ncbi:MAG: NAD-dependent epimerase/dehydratase family protein [Proteobacteria bacterium]|nr:NAD-dependent epimerase/dehydratase family protein [Pseudomonadota bacterium]
MTSRVLVSGGRGFIGRRLVSALRQEGDEVRVMTRGQPGPGEIQADLSRPDTLVAACEGVGTVYHCAGRAHAFSALGADDAVSCWRVNFEGTRALAEAAGQAGVGCLVFLSSVKAQAEPGGSCVDEDAPGGPETAYGQAKRAAEEAVLEAGRRYGMRVVNLRPAMVFGAGGRGNLERMASLVRRGLFPPLPETGNRRSMVHVNDLVAAMRLVAADPRAAGRTYIVAHPQTLSGRRLYDALRQAVGLPPVGWAVPQALLLAAARCGDLLQALSGRRVPLDSEALGRLLDSACYSPQRIERELGWRASVSLEAGLREMLCGA